MASPRYGHTATLLNDGKVLITGGSILARVLASVELYDPSTGKFAPGGNMTVARYQHIATLLPDGRVLIVPGGDGNDFDTAEIYDAENGVFTAIPWSKLTIGVAGISELIAT